MIDYSDYPFLRCIEEKFLHRGDLNFEGYVLASVPKEPNGKEWLWFYISLYDGNRYCEGLEVTGALHLSAQDVEHDPTWQYLFNKYAT